MIRVTLCWLNKFSSNFICTRGFRWRSFFRLYLSSFTSPFRGLPRADFVILNNFLIHSFWKVPNRRGERPSFVLTLVLEVWDEYQPASAEAGTTRRLRTGTRNFKIQDHDNGDILWSHWRPDSDTRSESEHLEYGAPSTSKSVSAKPLRKGPSYL